jgi:hypothetical protein
MEDMVAQSSLHGSPPTFRSVPHEVRSVLQVGLRAFEERLERNRKMVEGDDNMHDNGALNVQVDIILHACSTQAPTVDL